ncbi:MAG: hypothetical protein R2822_13855 [Spirosomataceae bacterium]
MKYLKWLLIAFGLLSQAFLALGQSNVNQRILFNIKSTRGLVAFWDFKEEEGQVRKAVGKAAFPLKEQNGTIPRLHEGPLSGYSAKFDNGSYLSLPNTATGALNIYGKKQGVTVVAWVKWIGEQTGFVGGMWNEYQDGGKRQYGLFVSLPHYNGKIKCVDIFLTLESQPLLFHFPATIRPVNKKYLPMNGFASLFLTMENI